jgi:hypothetical protein
MKTFKAIRSKEIINLHQINHQSRPNLNFLKVGKEITSGSSSRGLGNMLKILVGGAGRDFLSLVKEKVNGGCCGHNKW